MEDYSPKSFKNIKYIVNTERLRDAMIQIHLNHLHNTQLGMIDEAVSKSDFKEAKEVIKYIMEK
jgi:hypothetical protein